MTSPTTIRYLAEESIGATVLQERLAFRTSGLTAKNRLLKAPMSEKLASFSLDDPKQSGIPTDRLVNLHEKFSHGGFGMVITGNVMVSSTHLQLPGNVTISAEGDCSERRQQLARLAAASKSGDSLAIIQLSHAGRKTPALVNPTPLAPSAVQLVADGDRARQFGVPVATTTEQVKTEVVDRFVFAATEAYKAGFDGIELHAAHGFLLAQFLSAKSNLRTDQYGGSAENRLRILQEIYRAIRTEIPATTGFAIGVTINSVEFENDAHSTDDAKLTAKALDDAGFDFIELSGGAYEHLPAAGENKGHSTLAREAFFLKFLKGVRPRVRNAVVYVTGGFRTRPGMMRAVREGITDGIGIARPVVAEPDIAKKLLFDGIRSVAVNHFESNFKLSVMAATTQMFQAGSTSLSEANGDCCRGIVDLSKPEAAEKYRNALEPFVKRMRASNQQGVAKVHIFEYVADA